MAAHHIPYLHNEAGVQIVHVGAKEFMCIGAKLPFDHPHVYLDMGSDSETICPYCSTLYRYRTDLHADQADPQECLITDGDLAAKAA
jgi:uncharacterized Zn-finger protein